MTSPDLHRLRAGWDHTVQPQPASSTALVRGEQQQVPLRAQILSLFSDPRVETITAETASRMVERPLQDVENMLEAMLQAGELRRDESGSRMSPRYRISASEKLRLERMFREAATELGEHGVLMRINADEHPALIEDETEEPRLPITAGLLSLFLPGTGQLLNGDVGRASLVFAVWSLAWITHLSPVWTFVCLYAGAEAFFTAKIRSMERKMAREALSAAPAQPQLPPNPSAP